MPFDPYHTWLGIRPEEQPPNHYRLLGLSLFEDSPAVVDHAADRQMAHVRTFQSGPHAGLSQRLLSEITLARICLINPQKRAAYDAELRKTLPPPPAQPPLAETQPIVVTVPLVKPEANQVAPPITSSAVNGSSATRRRKHPAVEIAKIVAGGLAGILISVLLLRYVALIDITGLLPVPKRADSSNVVQRQENHDVKRSVGSTSVQTTPVQIPSIATPIEQGPDKVPTDTLLIYNTRNWTYGGGGTKECSVELRKGSNVVWKRENVALAWDRQSNPVTSIEVPIADFDTLRINIVKWIDGGRGGLSEVELIHDGRNLLLNQPAVASEVYDLPGSCTAQMVVDGIRDEVAEGGDGKGYWLLPKSGPGWIEISLDEGLTAESGTSTPEISGPSRKLGKKAKKKGPIVAPSPETLAPSSPSSAPVVSPLPAVLLAKRLAAPTSAEQEAIKKTLEELYGISRLKTEADKLKVASDLRNVARDTKDKPAEQFVALRQAAELAQEAGNASLVAECIDALAQRFDIDALNAEATMLVQCAQNARTSEAIEALVTIAKPAVVFALAEGEIETAKRLTDATMVACNRPNGLKFRKLVSDGQKEINRQHAAWKAYQQAILTLQAQPNDAAANLKAGEWLATERNDWAAALPYLVRSGNPLLQRAAELDLAKPTAADALVVAADAWFDAGKAPPDEPLWRLRARALYQRAKSGGLEGLLAARVDRRLDELAKDSGVQSLMQVAGKLTSTGRLRRELSPIIRRHCVLAFAFEAGDIFSAADKPMLRDRSGQENHGSIHGTTVVAGRAGSAVQFQSESDYVESPDQPSLNPNGSFSICAWIYQHSPVRPGGADDIVSKEEFGGGTGSGFSLRLHDRMPDFNFGSGSEWMRIRAPQAVEPGKWMHLAGVYDGQHEAMLIDGVEVASVACSKPMSVSSRPVRVGRGPFAQDRRFQGIIDEVAMFNIALTGDDIRTIYSLGAAGTPLAD